MKRVRKLRLAPVLIVGAITFSAGSASGQAQTPTPFDQCGNPAAPSALAVEVCSGLINQGQYQAGDLEYLLISRGNARARAGDSAGAIIDYDLAQTIVPASIGARYNRALARIELDQFDAALTDLDQVVQSAPDWPNGHSARGDALGDKGDNAGAIAAYTRAIELQPQNASAYVQRGVMYLDSGDLDQGIVDLNAAIRIEPDNAHAYYMRGLARLEQGGKESALRDFTSVLDRQPQNRHALERRAQLLTDMERFDQAVVDYDALARLDPRDAVAHMNGCILRLMTNALDVALASCNAAAATGGPHEILIMRGVVHLRLGDYAAALVDWRSNPATASLPVTLYGQGLALIGQGSVDQGQALITRAKAEDSGIEAFYARLGVRPWGN